jgi:methionine sulfoxide reductase catalytic subunit
MLLRRLHGWEIAEREAAPEAAFFARRALLGMLLPSIVSAATGAAPRNPAFTLDRPITAEWAAKQYNNYYEFSTDKNAIHRIARDFKPRPWTVEVAGLCGKPRVWGIEEIEKEFAQEERLYRHRCVEAWAMAVPWMGFELASLLKKAEPKAEAKWVRLLSVKRPEEMPGQKYSGNYEWPYYEGLRLDEAMNPLAFLVTGMYGKVLPNQNGAPLRLALPWKYGFKSIKAITRIEFVASRPPSFWNDVAPVEYGYFSNVNPKRPHPRWSQAVETVIPNMSRRRTMPYNGYGEWVAGMYNGGEI